MDEINFHKSFLSRGRKKSYPAIMAEDKNISKGCFHPREEYPPAKMSVKYSKSIDT